MITDVNLQRDVLDELDWDPSVDVSQIGVIAKDGIVTLAGHVPEYAAKHAAEVAAKRVHGVRAVANEIAVRPPEAAHQQDDEEIAQAAISALKWDARIPDDRLQVAVEDGWITVEGSVLRQQQLQAIGQLLNNLSGIKGVTNSVTLVAPAEAGVNELQACIEAALRRSATVNSKLVAVSAEGAHVTLTGDVHSHAELDEAERIAWSARGVVSVRNCLTLTPWGHGPAEEWGY